MVTLYDKGLSRGVLIRDTSDRLMESEPTPIRTETGFGVCSRLSRNFAAIRTPGDTFAVPWSSHGSQLLQKWLAQPQEGGPKE